MGPGLKSLSCLTASGTGRRVRRALGSADPREQHVAVGLALGPAVHLELHVREDGAGPQGRGRHVGAHQGLEDVVGVHRDVAGVPSGPGSAAISGSAGATSSRSAGASTTGSSSS